MKVKDLDRFVFTVKPISATVVKGTLTELDKLRLTANNKAEQEVINQYEAFGESFDLVSAQREALKKCLGLADQFKDKRIRIHVVEQSMHGKTSAVTLGLGEFERTDDALFGLGAAPVVRRVESIGMGESLVKAFDQALAEILKVLK